MIEMLVRDEDGPKPFAGREKVAVVTNVVAVNEKGRGVRDDDTGVSATHVEAMQATHLPPPVELERVF